MVMDPQAKGLMIFYQNLFNAMKKIFYVMHVNWGWIKQRPHFFAEGLSRKYNINLFHPIIYKKKLKSGHVLPGFNSNVFFKLPDRFISKYGIFYILNCFIVNFQISFRMLWERPDILWLTHPVFSGVLRFKPSNTKIIYDCMDDHQLFWKKENKKMISDERNLIAQSDILFFSSETLMRRKILPSEINKSFVVNNGCAKYFVDSLSSDNELSEVESGKFVIGYFGAIAEWFDWDAIHEILRKFDNVYFKLAGPCEKEMPTNSRIEYCGVLRHEQLKKFSDDCDALIMPFKVNSLIEAVDPVKLYEYVSFLKPILAPRYKETERFSRFVNLYDDLNGLLEEVDELLNKNNRKYEKSDALKFIVDNTWDVRTDFIISRINYEIK